MAIDDMILRCDFTLWFRGEPRGCTDPGAGRQALYESI